MWIWGSPAGPLGQHPGILLLDPQLPTAAYKYIFIHPRSLAQFLVLIIWHIVFLQIHRSGHTSHEFHETCHSVTCIVLVNSHQRWKQTRYCVCFHLWCELTLALWCHSIIWSRFSWNKISRNHKFHGIHVLHPTFHLKIEVFHKCYLTIEHITPHDVIIM